LSALVVDQVSDNNVVQAAFECEPLDVVDAVLAELQVNDQLVLAIGQLITLLLRGENRTTGSACIGTVGADQATLSLVNALATVIEQLEWNFRVILTAWVQRKCQLGNIATLRVDSQVQYIRFDLDEVRASGNWHFGRGIGFARGTWNVITGGSVGATHCIGKPRWNSIGSNILSRQGSLAVVLVPVKDHDVGHDCQGDDQDRAFNIHDYSAIEEEREVGIGGTGS